MKTCYQFLHPSVSPSVCFSSTEFFTSLLFDESSILSPSATLIPLALALPVPPLSLEPLFNYSSFLLCFPLHPILYTLVSLAIPSSPSPHSRRFNNIVSPYTGSVSHLLSNALIIPLISIKPDPAGKENSKWMEGEEGEEGEVGEGSGGEGRGEEVRDGRERGNSL